VVKVVQLCQAHGVPLIAFGGALPLRATPRLLRGASPSTSKLMNVRDPRSRAPYVPPTSLALVPIVRESVWSKEGMGSFI